MRVAYECEILDGGDAPLFRLTAEDERELPLTGARMAGEGCTKRASACFGVPARHT